jgi:REP-associated tyrosine transposase
MRAYFVTLRTWRRGSLFGSIRNGKMRRNPVGREIAACWNRIPARFSNVVLDTFVVMPDHLHGIVMVNDSEPLPSILDAFQEDSASLVDCGIWRGNGRRHFIRDSDELDRIRHYIRDNPSRWPRNPRDLPPFSRG